MKKGTSIFVATVVSVVLSGAAVAQPADEPVRVAPRSGWFPAIAATGDGYGVVWWDFRDRGTPGRYAGGLRFARFSSDGSRVGDDVLLSLGDPFTPFFSMYTGGHLEALPGGDFLLFGQIDGISAHTLRLDPTGRPRGPGHPLLQKDELYPIRVATGANARVLIYSEWYGFFQNWSQRVDDDGRADGLRQALAYARRGGGVVESYTYDSDIALDGTRFFAAWVQRPIGIRLRELTSNGDADGVPELVHGFEDCPRWISTASDGRLQAIVYSAGCAQKDVFLITRDPAGTVSTPVPLAAKPFDEGVSPDYGANHPIRALEHRGTAGGAVPGVLA